MGIGERRNDLIFSIPTSRPRLSSRGFAAALFLPLVLLATMVAGCNDPAPDDPAEAAHTPIALEPIASIGCADCDGPELITPTVLTLLDDGRLVVLDRFEPFVRVFREERPQLVAKCGVFLGVFKVHRALPQSVVIVLHPLPGSAAAAAPAPPKIAAIT